MFLKITHKPEAAIRMSSRRLRGDTNELPSKMCYFLPKREAILQIVATFPLDPSPVSMAIPLSLIVPAMQQKVLAVHYSKMRPSRSTISKP